MSDVKKQMIEINQLSSELDGIYSDIAQSYGISDSIFWILSVLYDAEAAVSQTDLCNNWYYSKQTVNSAVASMVKKGWIELRVVPGTRNRKNIVLTEAGQNFCAKIMGETMEIEQATYSKFAEEERNIFIGMFKRLNRYMREEYEKKRVLRKV